MVWFRRKVGKYQRISRRVLLIQVPPEGRPADAQLFGGKGLIAAAVGESLVDGSRDDLFQRFSGEGFSAEGGLRMMERPLLQNTSVTESFRI